MNLVNELQISAENDNVLTVLRKTKRLASKLDRQDMAEWLCYELEGYPTGNSVPDYRRLQSRLCMKTNGYVPIGFNRIKDGIIDLSGFDVNPKVPLADPISAVLALIEGIAIGNGFYRPVDRDLGDEHFRKYIHPEFAEQVTFLLRLNDFQLKSIPEQIKDKVLDWACALECAGVNGEGMSFNEQEKQIAHSVVFNIANSHIEQLTNSGSNRKK